MTEIEETVIKIRNKEKQVFCVLYLLDKEQELDSISCSEDSEIFFNSEN